MLTKLLLPTIAAIVVVAAFPASAENPTPNAAGDCMTSNPHLMCHCEEPGEFGCRDSISGWNCDYSIGPTPTTQIGFLCEYPPDSSIQYPENRLTRPTLNPMN